MRFDTEDAILGIYDSIERACGAQAAVGYSDQGVRQGITSGKHLDPTAAIIRNDLINARFRPDGVYDQGRMCTLPDWFCPTKNQDLLTLDNGELVSAIELESVNSPSGNNANSRAEESTDSVSDAYTMLDERLLGSSNVPPVVGYVMIAHDCPDSRIVEREVWSAHFPIDLDFEGASYLDRFLLLCSRLRRKSLYQAAWLMFVNPEDGMVYEPPALLSYDEFITNIAMALSMHRAQKNESRMDSVLLAFTNSGSWFIVSIRPCMLHGV